MSLSPKPHMGDSTPPRTPDSIEVPLPPEARPLWSYPDPWDQAEEAGTALTSIRTEILRLLSPEIGKGPLRASVITSHLHLSKQDASYHLLALFNLGLLLCTQCGNSRTYRLAPIVSVQADEGGVVEIAFKTTQLDVVVRVRKRT